MPLAVPDGGAGRGTLAKSIAQLTRQYAGIDAANAASSANERGLSTWTPSDAWLKEWLAAHPEQAPSQKPGALFGADPGGFNAGVNGVPVPPPTTPAPSGPAPNSWGTGGEGGLQYWSSPDVRPPGADDPTRPWKYDYWGGSWRRDYDPNHPGFIMGET